MAVQASSDNTTEPLILSGEAVAKEGTITQDLARATVLLSNTVMAFNATTQEWVPFTSLVTVNGESVPRGIYLGDNITAAALVAGDITNAPILVGKAVVSNEVIVFDDDTLDKDDIVNPGTIEARPAGLALQEASSIFIEDTISISEFEN